MIDGYIERYGRRLYGLCVTLCASDKIDAEDLYQETWLRVCEKIDGYKPEYSFEGCVVFVSVYLCTISLQYGVACAAALCFIQISGGLILTAFLMSRKQKNLLGGKNYGS